MATKQSDKARTEERKKKTPKVVQKKKHGSVLPMRRKKVKKHEKINEQASKPECGLFRFGSV